MTNPYLLYFCFFLLLLILYFSDLQSLHNSILGKFILYFTIICFGYYNPWLLVILISFVVILSYLRNGSNNKVKDTYKPYYYSPSNDLIMKEEELRPKESCSLPINK